MRKEKLKELKSYIEELKYVSVKKLEDATFLKIIPYSFTLKNGKVLNREQIIKGDKDGSAVIVVPITKEEEILTVIEPRVFTKDGVSVGFPAGYIETNETSHEAGIREMMEETGYVCENIELVDSFYQDEGCSSAYNYIFIADGCEKKFEQKLDESEEVRFMTFTLEELLELEKLGYINSSNNKLALVNTKKYIRK